MLNTKSEKRILRTLIAALVAFPIAGSAIAAGFGPGGGGYGYGMGQGCPGGYDGRSGGRQGMQGRQQGQHIEGRIAYLKAEIGITEAQEAEWQAVEQTMREGMATKAGMRGMKMRQGDPAASSPDRIAERINLMETRLEHMKKMESVLSSLYEVLTPEQQQSGNMLIPGRHRRMM